MIKKEKHSCKYDVHKEIIHKLSQKQIFWLCVIALSVIGMIGINMPSILLELL